MQSAVAPPLPPTSSGGQEAVMFGAVSPGAPATVFVPVAARPQRQPLKLTPTQQRAMKALGVMQILIGVLCILISSILVSQGSTTSTDKVGAGIWGGVFFLVPGALALVTASTNKVGWIIATMVMSILSSLMIWNVLAFSSASVDSYERCRQSYSFWDSSFCATGTERNGYTAADSLLIALSIIELVVAIWCAALCCQTVCCRGGSGCCSCCCEDSYASNSPQIVHYANVVSPGGAGEQRIIIMPHSFGYGAGALSVAQNGFAGAQLQAAQPTAAYVHQAYGPPTYGQQPPADLSCPPNYYYNPNGGGAAASWAAAQPSACVPVVQQADPVKRPFEAGTSYGY